MVTLFDTFEIKFNLCYAQDTLLIDCLLINIYIYIELNLTFLFNTRAHYYNIRHFKYLVRLYAYLRK